MSAGNLILRRKTLVGMFFAALVMLGVISLGRLPVELIPAVELPYLFVLVRSSAPTSPHTMETEAVIPLEGAVGALEGIERIESVSLQNQARITLEYESSVDITYAYLKLQERISEVRAALPEQYTAIVYKVDMEQMSNQLMDLQVRGGGGADRVRQVVERSIRSRLEGIDGIATVEITGGREKSVEVVLDDAVCDAYGITVSRVSALIGQHGASNTFVGHARESGRRHFVNVVTEYTDIADLERIVIDPREPVLLGDIAEVFFGVKAPDNISRVNGLETVSISLVKDQLVNMIEVSGRARAVIEQLGRELAEADVEIVIRHDAADQIRTNINLIVRLAILGGLLAAAILWFFLRNLRLVLIIAAAIPVSVYTAFNFFYAAGVTINSLTLVGMALAVGMLLDNSVVVLENIFRLHSRGADADTAVVRGVGEVWRSIVAATATTITVFLPFIFSSDLMIRTLGMHVGVSIISTLLVSLAVALLLVPMVTHAILARGEKTTGARNPAPVERGNGPAAAPRSGSPGAGGGFGSGQGRAAEIYLVLLKTCMRFPARTVVLAIVVFFASVLICLGLSVRAPRQEETGSFDVFLTMPKGSLLETTDLAVADLEQRLEAIPEKRDVTSRIYAEEARITVSLADDYTAIGGRTIAQVREDASRRLRGFRAGDAALEAPASSVRFRGGGRGVGMGRTAARFFGFGAQEETIIVKGSDYETMRRFAENLRGFIDNLPSTASTGIDVLPSSPELRLLLDARLMSYHGITPRGIRSELASFPREFSTRTTLKSGSDEYAIVIRRPGLDERRAQRTIDELRALPVPVPSGAGIDLGDLGRMVFSQGETAIRRINQEKQIAITYTFIDEIGGSRKLHRQAQAELEDLLAGLNAPAGIAVGMVAEDTFLAEFKFLILAAFILIYMILAAVFESLTTPLVMMFTIPLAAIGSLWMLIFTRTSILDPYTLTGFLILLGVVVNNGIILIDYSLILRRRGFRPLRALITAGLARTRPIMITAITTIVAMVPLAMGKTEQVSVIGAPFAVTVIGGLALSTLFTLIFIPVVHAGLARALAWLGALDRRLKIMQALLLAGGAWFVLDTIDSLIWRAALLIALVLVIPAAVWFVQASLRSASETVIDRDSQITITVRNLVKIYQQQPRFVREWTRGPRVRERRGVARRAEAGDLLWQLPLLGFGVYFVYFYLVSFSGAFVLSHAVYFLALYLHAVWHRRIEAGAERLAPPLRRAAAELGTVLLWGVPAASLAAFYLKWRNLPGVIFIALLWFAALFVFTLSRRLHGRRVRIARIEGRLAGTRRALYRLVTTIPVIGRRSTPFRALDRISLEIGSGMFGLLGPNGAGKTTLMRIICGILDQSYGKVRINGIDTSLRREELQGLIGYLPQEFGAYENMTAREFLDYQAILKGLTGGGERRRMVDYVLGAVHIEEHADRRIGSFSGGMKQRVGIAQILLHLPRILVVDEPTAGLDPRERIRFRNLLVELSRERVVIFSTHIIEDIYSSCNRVAVLDRGRLLYLDDPARMAQIAEGHVFAFSVAPGEFETIRKRHLVVHHMRDGDAIRVRCLAAAAPVAGAAAVRPTLEDAYLWLLRESGRAAPGGGGPAGGDPPASDAAPGGGAAGGGYDVVE